MDSSKYKLEKMPKFNKKEYVLIISLLLINLILIFNIAYSIKINPPTNSISINKNAIVTNIWLNDALKLDKFKQNNIKYLITDVGDTSVNGKIITPKEQIIDFINFVNAYEKKSGYDFDLLPYSEIVLDKYNLETPNFQNNLIEDYVYLNQIGFNGVLIDIEKIPPNQRTIYINFIDRLKNSLPPKFIISVYSGQLSDSPNEWEWPPEFMKEVSDKVDIISFGAYDTGLATNEEYISYIKEQIIKINSLNSNAKFLFGLPTHKNPPETIENAITAFTESPSFKEEKFIGLAIFAEWTTDDSEWAIFDKYS